MDIKNISILLSLSYFDVMTIHEHTPNSFTVVLHMCHSFVILCASTTFTPFCLQLLQKSQSIATLVFLFFFDFEPYHVAM